MNHLERIAAHLGELDAVLLTGESNCYYATGFMGRQPLHRSGGKGHRRCGRHRRDQPGEALLRSDQ